MSKTSCSISRLGSTSTHCSYSRSRVRNFRLCQTSRSTSTILPPFHYSITPLLHHSITPSLHYSITPSLQFSKHRPQLPGREFLVTHAGQLALGLLTAGNRDDFLEDARAHLLHSLGAVKDRAGIDVHVLFHPPIEGSVGGHFDARSGFAAIDATAAGGEHGQVAAAGYQARHADGVVSGRVHETKARRSDRFRVFIHCGQ